MFVPVGVGTKRNDNSSIKIIFKTALIFSLFLDKNNEVMKYKLCSRIYYLASKKKMDLIISNFVLFNFL